MAYWLDKMMIEKARDVAQRALSRIDQEKVKDKVDIWIAYLNMENTFGTRESFDKVFKEALDYNDRKQIYLHTVAIFIQSRNDERATELFKTMAEKFKGSKQIWVKFGIYLYRSGKAEEARKIMKRSLLNLPHKKHVEVISKFAQLEFSFGEAEIGRSLFENLLTTYP